MYEMVNKYYQKHKERLGKEAPGTYQNLSEEEKDKSRKKSPRQIPKSSWRTKTETTWAYENYYLAHQK